jgi:predicted permease
MLGVRARAGRLFVTDEDSPGHAATAVLSYGMWGRRYGYDPHMIGKSILINGQPYQVVGILPAGFALPREVLPTLAGTEQADILLPLPLGADAAQIRIREDYNIMGKLKRGVSLEQARADMDTLTARLRRDYPEVYPPNGRLTFGIVPLLDQVVGDVRRMLWMLLGAVGFVLLIACANVANLLLSRAMARQQEIGVRAALGASRGRIVRQLLTESVMLAIGGGVLGILFSVWSLKWIHVLGIKSVPRLEEIGIDGRVLLFTLALSLAAGILFGLAPAWRVARVDLQTTLRHGGRGSAGMGALWGRGNNARKLLVVSELALSVVLLIGAGLLIRSFARLEQVPPGFDPRNVLTFDLTMAGRKYADAPVVLNTYRELWQRLERLPGVTAAGGTTSIPLSEAYAWTPITVEGRAPLAGEKFINSDARVVGGNYFQAMGIPLRRGRFFNEQDTAAKPRVIIIDEHMAEEFWPKQDPIGKRIHIVQLKSSDPWQIIVGVVGRVKQDSLDSDPRIAFYLPQTQSPSRAMTVVVRGEPAKLTAAVKNEIRGLDRELPMYSVRTMQERVDESLARRRFFKLMLSLFAGLALTLATVGIYGVMAYLVSQGTREIGIRIAVGATQRAVVGLVVRQGMTLALLGMGIGLAGAFVLTRLMRSLLFGVEATDGFTFTVVAAVLVGIALLACAIPARRAARVDAVASLGK